MRGGEIEEQVVRERGTKRTARGGECVREAVRKGSAGLSGQVY